MQIDHEVKLDFKDVLIRPKRSTLSSRSKVDITRTLKFKHSNQTLNIVPIIAANMDTIGTFKMAKSLNEYESMTALHKHYSVDELVGFFNSCSYDLLHKVFYSMGITEDDEEKYRKVCELLPPIKRPIQVCLDVANGYSELFVDFIKKFRNENPNITIMAGNVVTNEMTEELILAGADIVKIGIGPGSACTTRVLTGVGFPQLSAVIECSDAAHGLGGHICSDGGCIVPGDIVKAFGGGSDFVMIGGMLAGHNECDGKIIEKNNKKYMQFYGMSSETAMKKYSGGVANYRASEGKTVEVPFKGYVSSTMQNIQGGLRSAMTYIGAKKLKELTKRTTFVRVTQQENRIFNSN